MIIRRVIGDSMRPGLVPGVVVVAIRRAPRVGDIVIARLASREVIKRISAIENDRYRLRGDNASESVDSREFGPVKKEDILGVVMIKFPVAVNPPKVRKPYAVQLGWVAGLLMTGMALVHLFRIDTLLPLLDVAVPGGQLAAAFIGAAIMIIEVFAVPFFLRMKLSPLMHLKSGFDAILVPLIWLLITIWGFGFAYSTAQFGEFMATPSSWLLIVLNAAWLGFNYYVLWLLGYDRIPHALRKKR